MSTTHLDATIITLYTTILTAAGLTPGFAVKVIARVAERVELMYDDNEREEFVARTQQLMADHGYAVDVAAQKAAIEIVDDALLEMARGRGGGWNALYGPEVDALAAQTDKDAEHADIAAALAADRPDYRRGTAAELMAGDGLRLVDFFHGYAGRDLDRPLVVTHVSTHPSSPQILSVDVIDRASMVNGTLGNLPDGVAETGATLIFGVGDAVLIRR